jgi:hypothetical protein
MITDFLYPIGEFLICIGICGLLNMINRGEH